MKLSRQTSEHYLYEFEQDYDISYINYSPRQEHLESQLIITLERANVRQTFAFYEPEFADIEKNLITSKGVYIAAHHDVDGVEVGDIGGNFIYFTAKRVRNITPGG